MIFNPDMECATKDRLEAIQSERLVALVKRVHERVPFYRDALSRAGVHPNDIRHIRDIVKLPLTTKDDLRAHYPFGLFAVPLDEVLELHASSGTTGNPTVVGYTANDIALWKEVMARSIACAGGKPGDVLQNAYGYGLFTGGLGVHYGSLELGCTVVPTSSGVTRRQIKLLQDFGARILTCTPSYALHMAEEAAAMGVDVRALPLEIGIFGAEPWTDEIREEIEAIWHIKAMDIYGLSEIIGPGVAQECEAQDGLHVFSDVFYPEILDPNTLEPVEDGVEGELVLTTLTKEAIPLIRYRTRDITSITHERCEACGRTMPRIAKLRGRTDDMVIVRGVNLYPSQIEELLLKFEETAPHYQLVLEREGSLDHLEIQVEVVESLSEDAETRLAHRIQREIKATLGLQARVKVLAPRSLARSVGKAVRVIDNRNQ